MKAIQLFESPNDIMPTTGPYKGQRITYSQGVSRSFIISKDGKAAVMTNPKHPDLGKGDTGHSTLQYIWNKAAPSLRDTSGERPSGGSRSEDTFGKWAELAASRMKRSKLSTAAKEAEKAGQWRPEDALASQELAAGNYSGAEPRPGHLFPDTPERPEKRRARRKPGLKEGEDNEGQKLASQLLFFPSFQDTEKHFDHNGYGSSYKGGIAGRIWKGPKICSFWMDQDEVLHAEKILHKIFELEGEDIKEYWFEFGSGGDQIPGEDLFDYYTSFSKTAPPKGPELPLDKTTFPTKFEPHWKDKFRGQVMEPEKQMRWDKIIGDSSEDLVSRLID